jgi:glycosyltransferase involved in cell wall biosynthesis
MEKYLIENKINKNKIVYLPLVLDSNIYYSSKIKRLSILNNSSDIKKSFNFIITARLGKASNLEIFIKIFNKILTSLKGYDIVLNIYGDGEKRAFLENLVSELNLQAYVKFHGMISKNDIINILSSADVAVATLPDVHHYNLYGPIPTKVVDYYQYSVPLIFISNIDKDYNIVELSKSWVTVNCLDINHSSIVICDFLKNYLNNSIEYINNSESFLINTHFNSAITKKLLSSLNNI